jgi:hypothetical protein
MVDKIRSGCFVPSGWTTSAGNGRADNDNPDHHHGGAVVVVWNVSKRMRLDGWMMLRSKTKYQNSAEANAI